MTHLVYGVSMPIYSKWYEFEIALKVMLFISEDLLNIFVLSAKIHWMPIYSEWYKFEIALKAMLFISEDLSNILSWVLKYIE